MQRGTCLIAFFILMGGSLVASGTAEGGSSRQAEIVMWMQNYSENEQELMNGLVTGFEAETGIRVNVEWGNWTEAARKWMLVVTGGDHPDVGDMFWAWSHVRIGKGDYGPMALDAYVEQLQLERYFESSLVDVTYQGHVYGIPWRVEHRPMLYRADLVAEAGLDGPPDTWDDLVVYGKKLTTRGADGSIQMAGIGFKDGIKNDSQDFLHWMWQGGGEAMTMDGVTATLNTPEVIDAMQFVRDLIYEHEVVSPDVLDPSYAGWSLFVAGKSAIQPMGSPSIADMPPEFLAKIRPAIPTMGVRRTSYSGAGFFGVMHGTDYVEESVKWLEYLGRDENMLTLARMSGRLSPSKGASATEHFADEWNSVLVENFQYAHTSQHPNAAWGQIAGRGPGSPIYEFWADVLFNKEPLPVIAARHNATAQAMMDRANQGN